MRCNKSKKAIKSYYFGWTTKTCGKLKLWCATLLYYGTFAMHMETVFFNYPKGYLKVKVAQPCSTLWDPMDYKVHGILQAKILEWVICPFSRGSSRPRNQTRVSSTAGGFFTNWTIREAQWVKELSVTFFLLLSILSEIHLISESHQETLMHWCVVLI